MLTPLTPKISWQFRVHTYKCHYLAIVSYQYVHACYVVISRFEGATLWTLDSVSNLRTLLSLFTPSFTLTIYRDH